MQANVHFAAGAMASWLSARLDAEALGWMETAAEKASSLDCAGLERLLALAGRKAGKADLSLDDCELNLAHSLRPGWRPQSWTVADAARAFVLLPLTADATVFGETIRSVCRTADLATLVGLYRAVPLFPDSDGLDWQIGEGLRTSVRLVFDAIAHHSPVPQERFSEHRWNHMVLKALFIDSTLDPIVGLDARRNPALAATLLDHVHERRAAGRAVDRQVWRCMAPFAGPEGLKAVAPLTESSDSADRLAATLFLAECPLPEARSMLCRLEKERSAISTGAVSWSQFAD